MSNSVYLVGMRDYLEAMNLGMSKMKLGIPGLNVNKGTVRRITESNKEQEDKDG